MSELGTVGVVIERLHQRLQATRGAAVRKALDEYRESEAQRVAGNEVALESETGPSEEGPNMGARPRVSHLPLPASAPEATPDPVDEIAASTPHELRGDRCPICYGPCPDPLTLNGKPLCHECWELLR